MRVLIVHPGASWSTADVEAGLRYGLEQHGVQVIPYRLDQRIEMAHRTLHVMWRRKKRDDPTLEKPTQGDVFYQAGVGALEMALRRQVDVVLVVSGMYLHPNVLLLMKQARIRVCVLFTESPYDIEKELAMAKIVDGCWTHERSAVRAFRAVNPNCGYLPHAWHPEHHRPGPRAGDDQVPAHDVVFVGTGFAERIEWFSAIDWTGIDLGLYGTWDDLDVDHKLRPFVRAEQVANHGAAALYRRAKVGLNLHRTSKGWGRHAPRIAHAESLNPRAYELAACGAFFVTDDRAEVRDVFGDLVPTFRTPTEAAALMRLWLADSEGRARVRELLPARVAESSWVQRAASVIGDLQRLMGMRAA